MLIPIAAERLTMWPVSKALRNVENTPHSARHSYISTLQAQGVEIALVAKVVGHSSAAVTAAIYSHAVRGADVAATALEAAFAS